VGEFQAKSLELGIGEINNKTDLNIELEAIERAKIGSPSSRLQLGWLEMTAQIPSSSRPSLTVC
jgi:hypothetical protein